MAFPNWFNEVEYLNNKLADLRISDKTYTSILQVSDAIKAAGMNAFEHYTMFGSKEGLAPSKVFNVMEYCSFKLKALQADAATKGEWTGKGWEDVQLAIHNSGMSLGEHYTMFGTVEGVSMSNTFDTTAYLTAKLELLKADEATKAEWAEKTPADVAKAFQANGIDAYSHYMTFKGAANEVAPDAVFPSKDPIGGGDSNTFILKSDTNTIVGTAGNDLIIGERGDVLNPTDTIDGGAGTDEMRLFNANASDLANLNIASIKNVEIIKAIGSVAGAAAIDVSGLKDVQEVWNVKSTALTNITVTEGQAVGLEGTVGTTTISVKGIDSGANELDLLLKDASAGALAVGGATSATNTNVTVETLTIEAAGENNITALTAAAMKSLIITGTEGSFELAAGTTGLGALKTIDASGYAGDVTIGKTTSITQTTTETYKGGSGADKVYITANFASAAAAAKYDGGAGDAIDTLAIGGTSFVGAQALILNQATNWDVLEMTGAVTALKANSFNINDFVFSADTQGTTTQSLDITGIESADFFTFKAAVGGAAATANAAGANGLKLTGTGAGEDIKIMLDGSATIAGQAGGVPSAAGVGTAGGKAIEAASYDNLIIESFGQKHTITGGAGSKGNGSSAGGNGGDAIDNAKSGVTIKGDADLTIAGGVGGENGGTTTVDGNAGNSFTNSVVLHAEEFTGKLTTGGSTGEDSIFVGTGGSVILGTADKDVVTFNTGVDTFEVFTAVTAVTAGDLNNFTTLKSATAGDKISFDKVDAATSWKWDAAKAKIAVSDNDTLEEAVEKADAAEDAITWFVWKGDTYVVAAGGTPTDAADDYVVKIAGTTGFDLGSATFDTNTDTLTFA